MCPRKRKWKDSDTISQQEQSKVARANMLKAVKDDKTSYAVTIPPHSGGAVAAGRFQNNPWHYVQNNNSYLPVQSGNTPGWSIKKSLTYLDEAVIRYNDDPTLIPQIVIYYNGGPMHGYTTLIDHRNLKTVLTIYSTYPNLEGQYEYVEKRSDGVHVYVWKPIPAPEVTEFYTDLIVGWRQWTFSVNTQRSIAEGRTVFNLKAAFSQGGVQIVWPGYEALTAICDRSKLNDSYAPHENSPEWNCLCGIYAYNTIRTMIPTLGYAQETDIRVFGEVNLWGRIIRCSDGYRAQYAYPKRLFVTKVSRDRDQIYHSADNLKSLASSITHEYGIPCSPVAYNALVDDPYLWESYI